MIISLLPLRTAHFQKNGKQRTSLVVTIRLPLRCCQGGACRIGGSGVRAIRWQEFKADVPGYSHWTCREPSGVGELVNSCPRGKALTPGRRQPQTPGTATIRRIGARTFASISQPPLLPPGVTKTNLFPAWLEGNPLYPVDRRFRSPQPAKNSGLLNHPGYRMRQSAGTKFQDWAVRRRRTTFSGRSPGKSVVSYS